VRPYPLISIIESRLERQAYLHLESVLVQILRPHLGRRPSVVITTYSCKGDHWIHSGSLGLTAVLTGNTLRNTRNLATRTFAQVEPFKPSGALHVMCKKPVLCQSDSTKPFHLHMDTSAYGMGAILLQEGESTPTTTSTNPAKPKLHPVTYYSAMFTETEQNYDIYN
jgi:RNase H-like domain found in reverse transcriptase